MNSRRAYVAAIRAAGITGDVRASQALAGGCIHAVERIELASGRTIVVKRAVPAQAAMLEEELRGLRALRATNTVLVPEPIGLHLCDDVCVLVMQYLPESRADESTWRGFGEDLARLHQSAAGERYGFDADNYLGTTPQPNTWHDDWVEFNRTCRLGHQLGLARRNNLLSADEARRIERVIDRLEQLIPRKPRPALLQGDLWSGNALPTVDESGAPRIAVIDPACSFGDGWADIAMMRLFGGFPPACFDAYASNIDDRAGVDTRIGVYQLYHVMNHLNLFGRGYASQAMSLARSLGM